MKITKAEREAMEHLERHALYAFRSKIKLRTLVALSDKGLIKWDPFECRAELTETGRTALT